MTQKSWIAPKFEKMIFPQRTVAFAFIQTNHFYI